LSIERNQDQPFGADCLKATSSVTIVAFLSNIMLKPVLPKKPSKALVHPFIQQLSHCTL
jgi:hypothetical protein